MTAPLTWNLHGNDQLSGVLEKLDRTVAKLDHSMKAAAGEARQYGRAMTSVEGTTARVGAATAKTSGHLEGLSNRIASAASMLRGLAATAGVAFAAAGAAAGAFGIKTAAANEEAAMSFEVLLGTAKKAQDFLGQLQQFAAATPFEMPQLRTAASRLLAVGTQAKDIIPILTTLGDATAGMGTGAEGIERAVTALTQMRQKGRVQAEEMMQLTEAGIAGWDTLAAELHTTVADAMQRVTRRQVEASTVFDAIEHRAGPALQRVSGMMRRQATTLTGLWSTFKDEAGQALASFTEPAIPGLKRLLEFSSTAIPEVLGKLRAASAQVASIFRGSDVPQRLLDSIGRLGRELLPKLHESWNKIVKTVADNREGLEKLGRFVADVIIPVVGTSLVTSIDLVTKAFQGVIWAAARVVDAVKFMTQMTLNNLGLIIDGAANAWDWIPVLGPKLREAADKFDAFAARVMAKFDALDGRQLDVWINVHERGSRGEHGGSGFGSGSTLIGTGADMLGGPSRHARGGRDMPGWNLYGEEGPELHWQPGGGRTMTAGQTQAALANAIAFEPLRVEVYLDGVKVRETLLALKRRRGLGTLGF